MKGKTNACPAATSPVNPNTQPDLQDKTITENGIYTADTGYDGLGTVTVNVSDDDTYTKNIIQGTCTGAITVPNGTTNIRSHLFYQCPNITSFTAPSSLKKLGGIGFMGCTGLTSVDLSETSDFWFDGGFSGCTSLQSLQMPQTMEEGHDLPTDFVKNCSLLESIIIPPGLTRYILNSFTNCSGLKTVVFRSTPITLALNAFGGCTQSNLTIYVPWAEGEAGDRAPWGATNATIVYNHTYDGSEIQ